MIDLVSLGHWQKRGLLGRLTAADKIRLSTCLDAVGLTGFEKRPLDSLSGGQMQRALFARTMLQDADLILLDEPFNAVDARTIADLILVIKSWCPKDERFCVCCTTTRWCASIFPRRC